MQLVGLLRSMTRLAVEIDAQRDESVVVRRGEGDVCITGAVAAATPAICVSVCAEY